MKKKSINKNDTISLSAKQIKNKLEDSLAYDHSKYHNAEVLFNTKPNEYYKLPFSDFKTSISEELTNQQLLLENLHQYINETKLIEEDYHEEIFTPVEEEVEENKINVLEEIYEFDEIEDDEFEDEFEDDEDDEDDEYAQRPEDEYAERPFDHTAKKPRISYTTIKIVDVAKVVEKIKREAIEKNKGKPVLGRRQINKMLKPYLLKKNNFGDVDGMDEALTSIDIYLNAVNKIANNNDTPIHENSHDALELNINEILQDLEK